MTHPDVPDLPIEKPQLLEQLEMIPESVLNAMTGVEMDERTEDAALSLAKSYAKREKGSSYEECVLMVACALVETGQSIKGKLGPHLIGTSVVAAEGACRLCFPEKPELD